MNLKARIKESSLAAPLTIARMRLAGFHKYPKQWKDLDSAQNKILEDVWNTGFHVMNGFFNQEQCADMRAEIDRVLESHKEYTSYDNLIGDRRLFGAEKVSDLINGFNNDVFLQGLSDAYHAEHAPAPFTMAARLKPNDINDGKDHGWHRDAFRRQFKAILYLDDVDKNNGPFQYIKRSNHWPYIFSDTLKGNIPYMSSAIPASSVERLLQKEPKRLATITGKAGTLIITDTTGIHRGSTIKSGHRYALTNYYMFQDLIGPHMNETFGRLAYKE